MTPYRERLNAGEYDTKKTTKKTGRKVQVQVEITGDASKMKGWKWGDKK